MKKENTILGHWSLRHWSFPSHDTSMHHFKIVGILNITPDSYFDGGKFVTAKAAVKHVAQMLSDGADIIDIGGESTGPNAPDVTEEDERTRVIPVIKAIKKAHPEAVIS